MAHRSGMRFVRFFFFCLLFACEEDVLWKKKTVQVKCLSPAGASLNCFQQERLYIDLQQVWLLVWRWTVEPVPRSVDLQPLPAQRGGG